jgi:hypothetical protein
VCGQHGAPGTARPVGNGGGSRRRPRCATHCRKTLQPQARQRLQAIWLAPARPRAEGALDVCMAPSEAQEAQAAECLAQEREVGLTLYACPAEHWGHRRTTHPIASTCATDVPRVRP